METWAPQNELVMIVLAQGSSMKTEKGQHVDPVHPPEVQRSDG